ncbi:MAG: hypothetical protein A2808_03815 [Candidatus Moranbacteria bacterium RIFCSPHIGHO2_01_FULL_55_24]|nr:MAG: hypothetical protein A2808_03815 [Candidatus Moranbacteria bacterium RIFCSPHIGHO2_01_FULL_55_24]
MESTEKTTETKKEEAKGKTRSAHPGIVRWAVILGIAIVINMFLVYALQVVYPEPLYENFCKEEQVKKVLNSEKECVEQGGQWIEGSAVEMKAQVDPTMAPAIKSYCNADFTCAKSYESALELYQRNVFIVFTVIGLLLILASTFVVGADVLSSGLSFGGILALVVGSVAYWNNMDDIIRVVVLGVALAALLWFAWKKFRD